MIGVQSSIVMFPINLLIVSIFRNTRPQERSPKTDASKQEKTGRVSPSQTSSPLKELKDITPDTVMKVRKHIFYQWFWSYNNSSILYVLSAWCVSPLGHKENRSVTVKGLEDSAAWPGAPTWSAGGHQHSAVSGGGHHQAAEPDGWRLLLRWLQEGPLQEPQLTCS